MEYFFQFFSKLEYKNFPFPQTNEITFKNLEIHRRSLHMTSPTSKWAFPSSKERGKLFVVTIFFFDFSRVEYYSAERNRYAMVGGSYFIGRVPGPNKRPLTQIFHEKKKEKIFSFEPRLKKHSGIRFDPSKFIFFFVIGFQLFL